MDALTQEIESLRLGAAAETTVVQSTLGGLAPAASKIYRSDRGASIGGYGEVLFERFDHEREDGTASGEVPRVDLLRNVVYLGYKFDDRLLLNTEIEFEHAGVSDERAEGAAGMEFATSSGRSRRSLDCAAACSSPFGLVNSGTSRRS